MPVSFPCPRPRCHLNDSDTFTTAGAVALLCWEICITFDDELEYIWPSVTFITPISFFCSDKLFQQAQLLSLKVALPFPPIFRLVRPTVCP